MMNYDVSSKVEIRGILCGMLLGDAGRCRNNFFIQHSTKQIAYALFKKELLELITCKQANIRQWKTNQGYELVRVEPKLIPLTRVMVKRCYKNGARTVSRDFLQYLTLQGMAIWFMDDGSKSFKKFKNKIHAVEVTLNTYLSKEENQIIITFFKERWGINWGLNKSKDRYRLRMGTREARRFFTLIEPFVVDSMKYKINLQFGTAPT
ncbi:MAG: hypothetical protein WCB68_00740 [Pyrinomonadaceae bacterium]